MNLTEPHAGSDVGALRTRAARQADGTYRIKGTKIFITYGEHDMADNIVHLVLARLPDAPPGTKGISLFIVPKYLPNADGAPGQRNDLRCVGLEHKLGIHGSPTCVMAYGEEDGAVGFLLGEENRGMAAMFTMMNNARLAVGNQGVGIAERAYQQALDYAQERRQGRALGAKDDGGGMSPIIAHPDVRRMLMTMRALTQASRAICCATAAAIDWSRVAADEAARAAAQARVEILTPIAKGWSTDAGCEVASLGVQVHGGMGFIEETGAAQHMRDARILPIYDGTNGIQAIDLVARKLPLEGGGAMRRLIGEMQETAQALGASGDAALQALGRALGGGVKAMADASLWLGGKLMSAPNDALAGATPYLRLAGLVVGGWLLGKEGLAVVERGAPDAAGRDKLDTIRFYATNLMPQAAALAAAATSGVDTLGAEPAEALAS
jgi:butyryl-CoA dehydrogenase